jgi:hypothetical protein
MPEGWEHYPQTILEIYRDGWLALDLRRALGPAEVDAIAALGLGRDFSIVTACNPGARRLDERENHLRTEALETEVAALDCRFLRADGVSPDGAHRERGVAVNLSVEAALALAARWQQAAIFRFFEERFWIVDASGQGNPSLALPLDAN